ncbi:MAG TPA: S9 family peptidase [Chloroflexota bacterium]
MVTVASVQPPDAYLFLTTLPELPVIRLYTSARLLVLASCVPLAFAATASGQGTVRRYTQVAISPDGKRVAWIGPTTLPSNNVDRALFVADLSAVTYPGMTPLVGADSESAAELAWSADSKRLAILATANGGSPAIYVMTGQNAPVRLKVVPGALHDIRWSPDGTRISALYSSAEEQANSPVAATPRDTGVIDSHIDRQHLAIINAASGDLKSITANDYYIYEYDWAPNGKQLVVSQARGSGNNNWWVAKLSSVDAATGEMRQLAAPTHQIANPRWSPDGSTIAYIGGLMSDQGVTGGDLYVLPATGGMPRNLTPGIKSSIASFSWSGPTTAVAASYAQGSTQVARIDMHTGAESVQFTSDEHVSVGAIYGIAGVSASSNGEVLASVRESFSSPPEIWISSAGTRRQLTHANNGVLSAVGRGVSVKWKSETFNVQGFLVYPTNFDATKKYPMIVQVHGGPSSSYKPSFYVPGSYEALESQSGYFIFLPNPRGSYGQGEAFTRANVKDFGNGDLKDIMAGVDEVLRKYPVDGNRMGIRGWSYGGFMTMWAVTQTNRFKAAVAGAGISNWLSYTGENGISEWMVPFFGATAYENKQVYEKSSPINFINNAKTPTLVVVGERDAECPAPQSFEFWRGLQHAGVATQLIVYPDEGHSFVQPEHMRDVQERTLRWMDSYLKAIPRAAGPGR